VTPLDVREYVTSSFISHHSSKVLWHREALCSCALAISDNVCTSMLTASGRSINYRPLCITSFNIKILQFALTVRLCFVLWTAIMSLSAINRLVLIMLALRVFGDVWVQLLNIICISITHEPLDAELIFERWLLFI